MAEPTVRLDLRDAVATLTLNRPQLRNALSAELIACLDAHLTTIAQDESIRAVVLCGAGRGFSAGADLAELCAGDTAGKAAADRQIAQVFERMAALPVPVVAALHGFALGGGFFLSLYADLRLAAPETKLGFPAAARQWIPPWALGRLAHWVGPRRAEQLLLTESVFSPRAARRWGLVDRLLPIERLLQGAHEHARQLAETPREVVSELRAFFAALRGDEVARWRTLAEGGFQQRFTSPAAQQALAQFFRAKSAEQP